MNNIDKSFAIGAYDKTRRVAPIWLKRVFSSIGAVFVGAATGLLGGGGGSLVVPLYQAVGVEKRISHGTAIATILPLSLISGAIYAVRGNYPMGSALWVTGGVVIGGIVGSLLLKRINPIVLSVVFYSVMIYAGARMLF